MKLTRCVKTGRSQCTVSGCPQGLSLHSIHQFYTFTKVHTKLNNNHCRFKNIVISTITYLHNCKGLWPLNLIRFVVNWSTNSRCCRNYFMSLVDQQTQEISVLYLIRFSTIWCDPLTMSFYLIRFSTIWCGPLTMREQLSMNFQISIHLCWWSIDQICRM
jgi:hypothetical protein